MGKFPSHWMSKSIAVKELTPIDISFCLWIEHFKNTKIVFLVDNLSIVYVLRSKTSRDLVLMSMVRKMVVLAMLNNVQFSALHVPGRNNVIADLISRFQVSKAKTWAPWLEDKPTFVPHKLLPWHNSQLE
ncbi:MAG: hypothetical protein GY699_26840 [Desulfobacteraceae bacterium]|nr:hypothetical protein [Desulfobacteraceae bacterium]